MYFIETKGKNRSYKKPKQIDSKDGYKNKLNKAIIVDYLFFIFFLCMNFIKKKKK